MDSLSLIFIITSPKIKNEILPKLNESVYMLHSFNATGISEEESLSMFNMQQNKRRMLIGLIKKENIAEIINYLNETFVNSKAPLGVAFTIETNYDLIKEQIEAAGK